MALTQSAWTESSVNGFYKATCTVLPETSDTDAYTLKTPSGLNGSKPFTLHVQFSDTPDASALPFEVWIGYGDNFALSGQGASVVAADGAYFKQLFDNVVGAVGKDYAFLIDPSLPVADVVTVAAIATGPKCRIPASPSYIFNCNGASTLAAETATYTIIQDVTA
jgi:hypothetical protein